MRASTGASRRRVADRSEPRVSVCIPTRDRAHWLGEALDSVIAQSFEDFELIVVDDGSTDGTREVVAARGDRRLRYLVHRRPRGVARSRNECLAAARGRYLAWLDSDDTYLPEMLATQVAALERHPGAVLAHAAFELVDETGRRLPSWPPPFERSGIERGRAAFAELALGNYVSAPTVLVRRSAYARTGSYRDDLASGEDWDMWLRMALAGDLVYAAEPLARYRYHAASLTRAASVSGAKLVRDLRVLDGIFARPARRLPDRAALAARARAALAVRALRFAADALVGGRRPLALRGVALAWRARPRLARPRVVARLVAAAAAGDEYRWHVAARAALGELAVVLEGSRLGASLGRAAAGEPGWRATMARVGVTVRRLVPPEAAIAAVDKWDPTLLHFAHRRGRHFPDRRRLPDGYPADGAEAIRHLEELRRDGVGYLVFPSTSFWWFDHYPQLVRHLESTGVRLPSDGACVIYRLAGEARVGRVA